MAFFALAAETEEEANYYERPYAINKMKLIRGQRLEKYLTAEEAANYPLTEMDKVILENVRQGHLVGTAEQIQTKLEAYKEEYNFDEAMIITLTDQAARLESYRLLAEQII